MEEILKSIVGKISSYQLFNYIFTGYTFIFLLDILFQYNLLSYEVIFLFPIFYYVGLVISRIGSLIIEPLLQKLKFVIFVAYPDFLRAAQQDTKIEVLSCDNNMYRTFCAIFFALLCVKGYNYIANIFEISENATTLVFILSQLILFLFSYRKQTAYVKKRVDEVNSRE